MKFHRHHLALFSPDGFPVSRWDRFRAKCHNAMQLSILVSGKPMYWAIPKRFRLSHKDWARMGGWYVVAPFHLATRFWHNIGGRWCLHRLALRVGALELEEGGYYADGRWRWPIVTKHTMEIAVAVAKISGRAKGKEISYRLIREAIESARKDEWRA